VDAVRAKVFAITNTGEHQHLRRQDRAARYDDLTLSGEPLRSAAGHRQVDTRGAPILDDDARYACVGDEREVASTKRRMQIRRGGGNTAPFRQRPLTWAVPFGIRAVEVVVALVPERPHRGEEGRGHRV